MPKEGARPKTCPLFYGWPTCSSIPCKLIHFHADSGRFKHLVNYRSELVPPLEDEPRVLRLNLVIAARVVGAAETDGSRLLEVGVLADEVLGAVADAPVGAGTNLRGPKPTRFSTLSVAGESHVRLGGCWKG